MPADPKPGRRIRDPHLLLRLKLAQECCCVCGTTYHLHLHHVVYRSHSGDDVEANCVSVCYGHHQLLHKRHSTTWASLRRYIEQERPDVLAYIAEKVGNVEAFFRV